ncbi:hypothetical protein JCM10212_002397 [Sporobolomyces blumeae]
MDDLFGSSQPESDPQADFLARERAALGADASHFGAGASAASLSQDKDYEQSAAAFPDLDGDADLNGGSASAAAGEGGGGGALDHDDDVLAGFSGGADVGHQVSVTGTNEFAAFEQEYPEIEVPSQQEQQPHSNGFHGSATDYVNPYSQPPSFVQPPQPSSEDSEFIQSWRTQQAEQIAEREDKATQKKEETIAKARNAIDNFYKEYNAKKEKSIAQNKDDEEKFKSTQTDSLAHGTAWDRICQLVDLADSRSKTSTKSKQDLSRFKEVLLSLKREGENAPGAAGY